MVQKLALVAAALALGSAVALILLARGGEDDAAVVDPGALEIARGEIDRAPVPLANVAEPGARSGATTPFADERPALGRAPRPPLHEAADLVLVRVVEGPSSAPMVDAEVSMQTPGHPTVYGVTDERGEFDFPASEVPAALGDKVSVVVKDEDGHERLRDGVVLARNVLLRAPSKSLLRGEIALASGESPEWLYVSIWSSATRARGGETFVGYQNLGTNGRFAIPSLGEPPPDFVRIEVARTGLPVSLRRSTTDMLVPPGPRIVVGLVQLQLAVIDENGDPVPEALVRCTATVDSASTQSTNALAVDPSTGVDGRARLWVPAGPLTIVAGANGYAPVRHEIRAEASTLEVVLRLRKLGDADRLTGLVVYEDGSAAAYFEVSGFPDDGTDYLARVSTSATRTDGEGRFVLPIATDRGVELRAGFPAPREPTVAKWRPGDGSVRIVIDRGQALNLQARGLPTSEGRSAGRIEVVLVRELDVSNSLETEAFPVSFDHVPSGHWRIYAIARGHERWAHGDVTMTRVAPEEVSLDFEVLEFVSGRVQPAPGKRLALTVVFTPSGWPRSAVEALLTVDVSADGTFRIPAPGAGEIVLREDSRTIERRPAVGGGAPLVFTLPD